MSELEQIEKDMDSIEKALTCLESMPAVRRNHLMSLDLNSAITELRGLTYKLQRKLDKAKDSKGQQHEPT